MIFQTSKPTIHQCNLYVSESWKRSEIFRIYIEPQCREYVSDKSIAGLKIIVAGCIYVCTVTNLDEGLNLLAFEILHNASKYTIFNIVFIYINMGIYLRQILNLHNQNRIYDFTMFKYLKIYRYK